MDRVCVAFPVLEGKTEDARAFFMELETQRKSALAASQQRINVTKESWHLQQTPQGDLLLAYIESPDFAGALGEFSRSEDEFDQWFKRRVAEVTGADLNEPPRTAERAALKLRSLTTWLAPRGGSSLSERPPHHSRPSPSRTLRGLL